jgi:hypothetical protein
MRSTTVSILLFLMVSSAVFLSCTTGVEPSPSPGLLRVTIKGVETDTAIVILSDTSEFSRWDNFRVYVGQGRIYKSDNYSAIYANSSSDRKTTDTANILGREWLNGAPITTADTTTITPQNSRYRRYVVFESYVPPGTYDRLYFGLTANVMEIFIPKHYLNPVQLPPGDIPGIDFSGTFTVEQDRATQIDLEIYPFESLTRYKDAYYFSRKMYVANVQIQ